MKHRAKRARWVRSKSGRVARLVGSGPTYRLQFCGTNVLSTGRWTLDQLHGVLGKGPQVLGFFSMADRRKKLHRELMDELAREHDVLETVIPTSADVERMGARRAAIVAFAPRSAAARAYANLWREVRERLAAAR